MTTTQKITLEPPEGGEVEIEVQVEWGDFQVNPCDKEPRLYRGEDDGRQPTEISLA